MFKDKNGKSKIIKGSLAGIGTISSFVATSGVDNPLLSAVNHDKEVNAYVKTLKVDIPQSKNENYNSLINSIKLKYQAVSDEFEKIKAQSSSIVETPNSSIVEGQSLAVKLIDPEISKQLKESDRVENITESLEPIIERVTKESPEKTLESSNSTFDKISEALSNGKINSMVQNNADTTVEENSLINTPRTFSTHGEIDGVDLDVVEDVDRINNSTDNSFDVDINDEVIDNNDEIARTHDLAENLNKISNDSKNEVYNNELNNDIKDVDENNKDNFNNKEGEINQDLESSDYMSEKDEKSIETQNEISENEINDDLLEFSNSTSNVIANNNLLSEDVVDEKFQQKDSQISEVDEELANMEDMKENNESQLTPIFKIKHIIQYFDVNTNAKIRSDNILYENSDDKIGVESNTHSKVDGYKNDPSKVIKQTSFSSADNTIVSTEKMYFEKLDDLNKLNDNIDLSSVKIKDKKVQLTIKFFDVDTNSKINEDFVISKQAKGTLDGNIITYPLIEFVTLDKALSVDGYLRVSNPSFVIDPNLNSDVTMNVYYKNVAPIERKVLTRNIDVVDDRGNVLYNLVQTGITTINKDGSIKEYTFSEKPLEYVNDKYVLESVVIPSRTTTDEVTNDRVVVKDKVERVSNTVDYKVYAKDKSDGNIVAEKHIRLEHNGTKNLVTGMIVWDSETYIPTATIFSDLEDYTFDEIEDFDENAETIIFDIEKTAKSDVLSNIDPNEHEDVVDDDVTEVESHVSENEMVNEETVTETQQTNEFKNEYKTLDKTEILALSRSYVDELSDEIGNFKHSYSEYSTIEQLLSGKFEQEFEVLQKLKELYAQKGSDVTAKDFTESEINELLPWFDVNDRVTDRLLSRINDFRSKLHLEPYTKQVLDLNGEMNRLIHTYIEHQMNNHIDSAAKNQYYSGLGGENVVPTFDLISYDKSVSPEYIADTVFVDVMQEAEYLATDTDHCNEHSYDRLINYLFSGKNTFSSGIYISQFSKQTIPLKSGKLVTSKYVIKNSLTSVISHIK